MPDYEIGDERRRFRVTARSQKAAVQAGIDAKLLKDGDAVSVRLSKNVPVGEDADPE